MLGKNPQAIKATKLCNFSGKKNLNLEREKIWGACQNKVEESPLRRNILSAIDRLLVVTVTLIHPLEL